MGIVMTFTLNWYSSAEFSSLYNFQVSCISSLETHSTDLTSQSISAKNYYCYLDLQEYFLGFQNKENLIGYKLSLPWPVQFLTATLQVSESQQYVSLDSTYGINWGLFFDFLFIQIQFLDDLCSVMLMQS